MTKKNFHGATLECVQGDIANQPDMDAVVNAANAGLLMGGGVAGAIHRAAGPGLEEECRPLAPIDPGQAVITGAHNLPNRHVIHCLGPVYGRDNPSDHLLAECYRNALQLAEQNGLRSVAFPALSTGAFGFPPEPAARIAINTIIEHLAVLKSVTHVRFVLFSSSDQQIYEKLFDEVSG
ncbi:MAG: macro domain-containing protein [Desulfobacteraceae bacterium]|nr:macro domain-containing protein [Desulfobacteraceae bacterium]